LTNSQFLFQVLANNAEDPKLPIYIFFYKVVGEISKDRIKGPKGWVQKTLVRTKGGVRTKGASERGVGPWSGPKSQESELRDQVKEVKADALTKNDAMDPRRNSKRCGEILESKALSTQLRLAVKALRTAIRIHKRVVPVTYVNTIRVHVVRAHHAACDLADFHYANEVQKAEQEEQSELNSERRIKEDEPKENELKEDTTKKNKRNKSPEYQKVTRRLLSKSAAVAVFFLQIVTDNLLRQFQNIPNESARAAGLRLHATLLRAVSAASCHARKLDLALCNLALSD
jgi:hypothetical protein